MPGQERDNLPNLSQGYGPTLVLMSTIWVSMRHRMVRFRPSS
ncbi:unnamed protein product [Acidithrix sp. C25]|nr:unnamed protein product [Acidithrix sp. C25]